MLEYVAPQLPTQAVQSYQDLWAGDSTVGYFISNSLKSSVGTLARLNSDDNMVRSGWGLCETS